MFSVASRYDIDFSDVRGQETHQASVDDLCRGCSQHPYDRPAGQRQNRVRAPKFVPTRLGSRHTCSFPRKFPGNPLPKLRGMLNLHAEKTELCPNQLSIKGLKAS